MRFTVGQRLGVYEVVSPLGAGGMGEVYRAIDTRLDRVVAVKLLVDVGASAEVDSGSPTKRGRLPRSTIPTS